MRVQSRGFGRSSEPYRKDPIFPAWLPKGRACLNANSKVWIWDNNERVQPGEAPKGSVPSLSPLRIQRVKPLHAPRVSLVATQASGAAAPVPAARYLGVVRRVNPTGRWRGGESRPVRTGSPAPPRGGGGSSPLPRGPGGGG